MATRVSRWIWPYGGDRRWSGAGGKRVGGKRCTESRKVKTRHVQGKHRTVPIGRRVLTDTAVDVGDGTPYTRHAPSPLARQGPLVTWNLRRDAPHNSTASVEKADVQRQRETRGTRGGRSGKADTPSFAARSTLSRISVQERGVLFPRAETPSAGLTCFLFSSSAFVCGSIKYKAVRSVAQHHEQRGGGFHPVLHGPPRRGRGERQCALGVAPRSASTRKEMRKRVREADAVCVRAEGG